MAELKTKETKDSVINFLKKIEPEQKKKDGLVLLKIFEKITGQSAVMWGSSIVGFGKYHYKSEKSRQEGDWPLIAFSPRKQNLSLYIMHGNDNNTGLLENLGKHKRGGGCLYINRLSDVDLKVLEDLIKASYYYMRKTHL